MYHNNWKVRVIYSSGQARSVNWLNYDRYIITFMLKFTDFIHYQNCIVKNKSSKKGKMHSGEVLQQLEMHNTEIQHHLGGRTSSTTARR